MLDQIRPCLSTNAEVRRRSDGTAGIYDAQAGTSFETTAEQAQLVVLFDGKRSLLEISAEYMNRHGYVPFAAIDELMWGLIDNALLVDPPRNLERMAMVDRSSWVDFLAPRSRLRFKGYWPAPLRAIELIGWPALAVWVVLNLPKQGLGPLDVVLFPLGLVLALTLRDRFKAAVCGLYGFNPRRTHLVSMLGFVHYPAPDDGIIVLMDRRARFAAHVAALLGSATALAMAWPWAGVWAGAVMVLLLDLCPLVMSSGSELLMTLTRQPHLRHHLRTYVGVPLLKDLFTLKVARGEGPLFVAGLYAMAWLGCLFFLIFGVGLSTAMRLIELGGSQEGPMQVLAGGGAMFLFALCPIPLMFAAFHLIESAFDSLWPRETGGRQAAGVADMAMFRAIPLFSKLSDADLKAISAQSKLVHYGAGELIVEEGAPGNTFYSVVSGSVVVARGAASERARVVARLGPGDCFGETAILKDGVRAASVRAATRATVIEVSAAAFEQIVTRVGGVEFASVLRAAGAIGKSKLFKELPPERLASLASKFVPRLLPAGADVVRFGDPGHEFFLIAKGQVEVLAGDGKKLTTLGDGDHFGEIALLRKVPRTATVRTTTETLVLVLERDVFLSALQADLALSTRVEAIAASREASDAPVRAAS
jgi:CRP-like cAMP-binding protein